MQNGLELLAPLRIAEYQLAHAPAIKSSVGVENPAAELLHDLLERRLTRSDHSVRDFVRIDHGHATPGEKVRNRALAACYATGQTDA